MDKTNKVFLVIKDECSRQRKLVEIHSFSAIAQRSGVHIKNLSKSLNILAEMGLIKYSETDSYIYLTELGRKKSSLEKA